MGFTAFQIGNGTDFSNYETSTTDPGWSFTIWTILVCVALNLCLPILVQTTRSIRSRKADQETFSTPNEVPQGNETNTQSQPIPEVSSMALRLPPNLSDAQSDDASVVSVASSASILSEIVAGVLTAKSTRKKHRHSDRHRHLVKSSANESQEIMTSLNYKSASSLLGKGSMLAEDSTDGIEGTLNRSKETPIKESSMIDEILEITDWDTETQRLLKLFLPYALQAAAEGIFGIIDFALIGYFLGVQAANVWIVVGILMEFTQTLTYGFSEAIGTLAPQAAGAGNKALAGRYLQLSIIFYTLSTLPSIAVWGFWTEEVVHWFGFDEETSAYAQLFVYPYLASYFIGGIDECLFEFLDAMGHEKYATIIEFVYAGSSTLIILLMVTLGIKDLLFIAIMQSCWSVLLSIANVAFVAYRGWLDEYWEGLVANNSLKDRRALRTMMVTAIPLSIAWILTFGEWEVLTIFVRYMGPAEVAAWGILGHVWDTCEDIVAALCDAAEVRVSFQMGAGLPLKAKKTAYKAIYLGSVVAGLSTALLFIISEQLPMWLTPDPTLQRMIFESIPLLGFGMLSMSVGNVCWSVVEGQGRVRLATSIEMIISWLVAIPLSYVLVYVFNYNLLGVVASLVVAYTITGQWMTYLVFCSDWTLLSKIVNERSRSRCDRCNTGSDNSNVHTSAIYDDCYWDELPEDVQAAAVVLGYTKSIWNKDGTPESDDKYWHQLCPDQQQAAQKLGFTEDTWDEDSSSSSSSSSDDSAS